MSGQDNPSRVPKLSPNSVKQGPLKATKPMSSCVKEGSSLMPESSPTVSPTTHWKLGSSHNAGQRSPGSSVNKGKSKSSSYPGIRRTASLDAIYLKGHWPRDNWLQVDRSTQTGDSDLSDVQNVGYMSDVEDRMGRFTVRDRSRGTKDSTGRRASSGENCSSQTPSSFRRLQKTSIRSSEEGLNQEIEQIVTRTNMERFGVSGDRFSLETPDGHRAPLADLLSGARSRSVNTQTPQEFDSSHSSSGGSQGSSPEQGKLSTSPHINKFVARAPPDGCERVFSKTLDNNKSLSIEQVPQPPPFKLKPSQGSAFEVLQPNTNESEDLDQPSVPPKKED